MIRNQRKSRDYNDYHRAKQTDRNTSVMAPPEFRLSYFVSIPFCRLACQVLSERIEIDSVTVAKDKTSTDYLRKILKAWGGSSFVNAAHTAAMEYGRAYLVPTGTDRDDGYPGCQVVPGRDMVHREDPFTGEVVEALRAYGDLRQFRAWYTRAETIYLERGQGTNGWKVTSRVPTLDGTKVAVFPLICRDEPDNPWGRPEAKDAFKLQDAACRIATDLAIASATMAVPQRALLGAEAKDFQVTNPDGTVKVDDAGNPVTATVEQLYMSRLLTLSDPTAKIAEFAAAQLQNFTTALNAVTRQAAATLGVPQAVFGVASDSNPASGEAIRQDDARLIRRAEQLTAGFEPAWEDLFSYLLLLIEVESVVSVRWMDPSLPNLAARADAIAKLASITVGGKPLYTWEELRRLLGDDQEVIDAAKEMIELEIIRDTLTNTPPEVPQRQAA